MKVKKIYITSLIICFLLVPIVTASCFNSDDTQQGEITQGNETSEVTSDGSENNPEEEFDNLLESEGFLEVLSSFFYPESELLKAESVEGNENLFYILLEITDNSEKVEKYYKDKKIQSIWSRAVIFEESSEKVEEEFVTSENENIPVFKFTYSSKEKDKVVNVLIKGLEESRTQIMIIYWNLQ